MKKIIYLICFLVLLLTPFVVFAFNNDSISVDKVFRSYADLQSQGNMNIPVHFKLKGSSSELSEVKMMKISVEDTCVGKSGSSLQKGDLRPEANDYQDGVIEGTLTYEATKQFSCKGKHDVSFLLCRTTNVSCTYVSNKADKITILTIPDVVEIGDTPPDDQNPPDDDNPPVEPGGGDDAAKYDALIPGEGKFLTIWDLLARIVQILLALASIVAVGAIIIGGYQYITSGGIPDKAQIAKSTITYAIIGLILVMIMYVAMRFILPFIGVSQDIIWF